MKAYGAAVRESPEGITSCVIRLKMFISIHRSSKVRNLMCRPGFLLYTVKLFCVFSQPNRP